MATPEIRTAPAALEQEALTRGLLALRAELELPGAFPAAVLAEAGRGRPLAAAGDASRLIDEDRRRDCRAIELVTLDPPGSRDLDQAFAIEPEGDGHRLFYAIADVAAHVVPGGEIDRESRLRGETLYLPDGRVPLHPPQLSEGSASLLPGEDRLAVLWTLQFDAGATLLHTLVERAIVRSRAQLDYPAAIEALARGDAHPQLERLAELGPRLAAAQRRAGAIELPEPEQELAGGDHHWSLAWAPRTELEDWNAQLSLATGRAAAALMLGARSGLLRTLPPAPADALPAIAAAAHGLGVAWPEELPLAERITSLDAGDPAHLALIDELRGLFRGAGHLVLAGNDPAHEDAVHSAVAAPYAHVTAPLRRLGDRFATECALAAQAGVAAPAWATDALPGLPDLLAASSRRAGEVRRGVLDLAEALVLEGRVGEAFTAAVVDVDGRGGADVRLLDPPVRARCEGIELVAGSTARVVLTVADPAERRVRFAAA